MRKYRIIAMCAVFVTVGGCRSAGTVGRNAAKFMAVGLWNGVFDDDVKLKYSPSNPEWTVADEDHVPTVGTTGTKRDN